MSSPMTTAELAKALKVTPATVSGWVRAGLIPFHQIGGRRYFSLKDVLDANEQLARPRPTLISRPHDEPDEFASLRARLGMTSTGASQTPRRKRRRKTTA